MWTDVLSRSGLDCADGQGASCAGDRAKCASKAGHYLGQEWAICPIRDALDDPYVQAVMQLEAASKLSPLSGWPGDFSAWVPSLWLTLRGLIDDRKRHALEQSQGGH